MTSYENTNLIERVAKELKEVAEKLGHQSELFSILKDPKTALKSNPERAQLNRALEVELQNIIDTKKSTKESLETSSNLPLTIANQEEKAIYYFNINTQPNYIKVIKQIRKLRTEGKINYTDLGNGKYSVTMSCGNKIVIMELPPDTNLSDGSCDYFNRDGQIIINKETTRTKLCSEEGQKYLGEKEKQGQGLLTKSEFQTLIQSLYSQGSQQEQILAFMIATGFYGYMWLKDKTSNIQLVVSCFREGDNRHFSSTNDGPSSIIYSTFKI